MKSKRYNLVIVALLMVMVGVGLWWFMRTPAAAPEKTVALTMPAKVAAQSSVTQAAQVALPKAPAVPAGGTAVVDDSPITSDPQANVKTAIADMGRLFRAGDFEEEYEIYTPPDKLDPQMIQNYQSLTQRFAGSPQAQQTFLEPLARAYEAMETQTPTYNAAGDEATYSYTPPALEDTKFESSPVTFIKINGKWYLKPASEPTTKN